MLKSRLLHPEILEALGRAGHSSKILIADGNYPFATQLGPGARLVSLNLSPGLVNATRA
jgi:L-fucose mutarotase